MSVQLKAGYAKVDITPSYPSPLGGYGNPLKRFHERVLDPLYAICVAVSDGENTVLMYHMDLTSFPDRFLNICREKIDSLYHIPKQNILFNSTHTHSAPALGAKHESIERYGAELCERLVGLVATALEDLSEASIKIGSGEVKGFNFVRRYLLSDGTYGGDNFGDFQNNTILGHETEADHTMQAIRLVREGKKDIVMVNWQGHPHLTGDARKYDLSSDLIEHFRNTVEEEHNVLFAFYQGCGGNINHHSRMETEPCTPDYVETGKGLAAGLSNILADMRPVKSGKIRVSYKIFEGPVNHTWDDRVEDAKKIWDFWGKSTVRGEATAYARSLGFNSVYQANWVIKKSEMPATYSYNIGSISFGDVCFAWTPNELYDVTGKYLKGTSPFEMTFVLGYTNGTHGYMPNIKAFAHGGYGCDTCRFGAGVTEKLTNELLDQILKVKE